MGKMDDFEPLPVEDVPSGTPADKPPITDRPVRKPRTRLTKWLAKIAGVYDGEMTPKTETEYYLNEIAENGGGSGLPDVDENADVGKILRVIKVDRDDVPHWDVVDFPVPTGGSLDAGKSLVVASGGGLTLENVLPASSNDDSGKVLVSRGTYSNPQWEKNNIFVTIGNDANRKLSATFNSINQSFQRGRSVVLVEPYSYGGSDPTAGNYSPVIGTKRVIDDGETFGYVYAFFDGQIRMWKTTSVNGYPTLQPIS